MKKNITILLLFSLIIISMISVSLVVKKKYLDKKESSEVVLTESVKGTTNLSNVPIIKNIAPTNAFIGQEYRFDPAIMDADTYFSNLTLQVVQGPTWLKVDGLSVVGIPPFYAEETNKIVLKISDGDNFTLFTFYILVQKPNESL
jgi:hypothetical protein